MHGLRHIFIALAKAIGTKAAIAVTTVSVAVSAGAVGTVGYVAVHQIQKQTRQTEQHSTGESRHKAIRNGGQNADVGQELSGVDAILPDSDVDYGQNDDQNSAPAHNQEDGNHEPTNFGLKANQVEKSPEQKGRIRQQRLAAAAVTVMQPTSAEYQALLTAIYTQHEIQSHETQQTTGSTSQSDSGELPSQQSTPITSTTPVSEPEPEPNRAFINAKAQFITPYVFCGEGQSSNFTYNNEKYNSIFLGGTPTKKYTVMLYFCGTDLETDGEAVTYDLTKLIKEYGYDNLDDVNILLCAGGTTQWKNTYMSAAGDDNCNNDNLRCNIYYVDPTSYDENTMTTGNEINADTCKLLGSYNPIDMGDPKLLAGFMNYCTDQFPAENYGMIMWNHGGGINHGVCFSATVDQEDLKVSGTGITSEELESALASSNLYQADRKLAFIGYDACLMGGIEQSYMVSPYVEYSIGSSEISCGDWEYQKIINGIVDTLHDTTVSQNEKNEVIAKKITECYYNGHDGSEIIASIACFDSSNLQESANLINDLAEKVNTLYDDENMRVDIFQALKQARIHTNALGTAKSRTNTGYNEAVDLYEFMINLQEQFEYLETKDVYKNDEAVCAQFDQVKKAIQAVCDYQSNYLLAYGIQYNHKKILYSGETVDQNSDYWNALKGALMSATSIYVPYFSPEETDYYGLKIMEEYTTLMSKYSKDLNAELVNDGRVKRLAKEINYGELFINQDESAQTSKPISMKTTAGSNYLNMQFKSSYDSDDQTSNGSTPFTDFMDTIDKINVYVSRYQAPTAGSSSGLDIVYGSKEVDLSAIANRNEQINIPRETLSNIYGYMVHAYDQIKYDSLADKQPSESAYVYDWATLSDLEKDEDQKKANLNKLGTDYTNNTSLSWLSFVGRVGKQVVGTEDSDVPDNTYDYKEAFLYFRNSVENENEYQFAGATYVTGQDENEKTFTKTTTDLTKEYSVLQFYHNIVDSNGRLQTIEGMEGNTFSTPVLSIDTNMYMYKTNLTDDTEKIYNDYTIGFTTVEGTDQLSQTYIAPTGNASENSDEYRNNTQQIGTSVSSNDQGADNNKLHVTEEDIQKLDGEETSAADLSIDQEITETAEEIDVNERATEATGGITEITEGATEGTEGMAAVVTDGITEAMEKISDVTEPEVSVTSPVTETVAETDTGMQTPPVTETITITNTEPDTKQESSSEQNQAPVPIEAIPITESKE